MEGRFVGDPCLGTHGLGSGTMAQIREELRRAKL